MKTPDFWKHTTPLSIVLAPIGWLYGTITALRFKWGKAYKAPCPVICIGNLTAGGTGKTPVSLSIAHLLQKEGKNPCFISRGYGGKLRNIIVNKAIHSAQQVGDEPLLLAQKAQTAISPNRAAGAKLAVAAGANCLIMDDGFQNPGLYKDLSFLVFDGSYGIGNGKIIPAGPLRETFTQGLKRADAVIILGEDKFGIAEKSELPAFYGSIKAKQPQNKQQKALAFAGIGHPQKFYNSLKSCGIDIVKTIDFPDHHFYTTVELRQIIDTAAKQNLQIFTTSKDYVKIPQELQTSFQVLDIEVIWENPDKLKEFITSKL